MGSGITLAAFLAAVAVWAYRTKILERERTIRSAPEGVQRALVERTLEFFQIDTTTLTREQKYNLALRQIHARARRFTITAIVVVTIAFLAAGISVFAILRVPSFSERAQNDSVTPNPAEPRTVVMASTGQSIFREFDLRNNRLELKIGGLIINNQSEVDDLIKQVEVVLTVPGLRSEDITSSYGKNLRLIDQNGKDWGSTFVLKKSEKVILECRVSFDYSERSAGAFTQEGLRRLAIKFKGNTNKAPEIDYCYREDLPFVGNSQNLVPMECPKNFQSGG